MITEKKVEGYKRKKLKRTVEPSANDTEQTSTEMDVEKDVDGDLRVFFSITTLLLTISTLVPSSLKILT